jgi:large subunit ribosomal protein L9
VEKLGRLGDIVQVRNGYGRNYLVPKGFAMPATPANLKLFELERKKLQARMEAARGSASALAQRIEGLELVMPMRVGDNDKLYGSVTSMMIAGELAQRGIEMDRHRILLDAPIRTLGAFEVRARLHADVQAVFVVKVVPEERTFHDDAPSPAPARQKDPAAEPEPAE